jgi:hypothetical protein
METRRRLLQKLGIGAAVAAAGAGLSRSARAEHHRQLQAFAAGGDATGAPWWLLEPLEVGARLSDGWTIAALTPVERGAAVLELRHDRRPADAGGIARVHLCAHGGKPRGLAHSRLFDLVLMDGGQGDQPTDPRLGRVLVGVARRIRRNEVAASGDLDSVSRMLTHAERVALYGPETLT